MYVSGPWGKRAMKVLPHLPSMLVTHHRRRRQERLEEHAGPRRAAREFPPATSSVPEARHWARSVADAWSIRGEVVEHLTFDVTELAANAVIHARSPFRVLLQHDDGWLRIEVEDASPEEPREMHAAPEATAGRGLALVRALSTGTGVVVQARGKRVWAELDV